MRLIRHWRATLFAICLATTLALGGGATAAAASAEHGAATPEPLVLTPGRKALLCRNLDYLYGRKLPGLVSNCFAEVRWKKGRYKRAIETWEHAASWGDKAAQYSLGLVWFTGRHVQANKPLGIAWLALAAERGDQEYARVLASAMAAASPREQLQARIELAALQPQYGDAVAAARAWKRYDHVWRSDLMMIGGLSALGCRERAGAVGCNSNGAIDAEEARVVQEFFRGWSGMGSIFVLPVETLDSDPAASSDGQ